MTSLRKQRDYLRRCEDQVEQQAMYKSGANASMEVHTAAITKDPDVDEDLKAKVNQKNEVCAKEDLVDRSQAFFTDKRAYLIMHIHI